MDVVDVEEVDEERMMERRVGVEIGVEERREVGVGVGRLSIVEAARFCCVLYLLYLDTSWVWYFWHPRAIGAGAAAAVVVLQAAESRLPMTAERSGAFMTDMCIGAVSRVVFVCWWLWW